MCGKYLRPVDPAGPRSKRSSPVPQIIVLAFDSDGIIEDPDGRGGRPTAAGSSADGPPPPDHFRLGSKLDTGVLLLGRTTWELFSHIWPGRTDDFSAAMNRMPNWLSRALSQTSRMGELVVDERRASRRHRADQGDRDVIITGSASVVHALEEHDRVDEYRILFFPTALATGPPCSPWLSPVQLRLLSAEASGGHPREVRRFAR